MQRSKLLALCGAALVLVLLAAGFTYFRSSNTRLTGMPVVGTVAQALHPGGPLRPPAHVVIVIEENKAYRQIAGNLKDAPYLNSLLPRAALLTNSHGIAHPSQPNYIALFSGVANTDGDSCDVDGVSPATPSLGGELLAARDGFAGYAEDLPSTGFTGCYAGQYARKHAPWTHFTDVPASDNQPFSKFPAYDKLPTVALVIPNLLDDMHSASIHRGDAWLQSHLGPLIDWSFKHDTLVIVTWDEDNGTRANHIPTFFIGPMVKPGKYDVPVSHYNVLRTIEDFYRLKPLGASATAGPITGIWKS